MADLATYRGKRVAGQSGPAAVFVNEHGGTRRLALRRDLRNHSPDGFQWGYGGSGPAQLALAMLADATDDAFALEHYQEFKREVIALIEEDDFVLARESVQAIMQWKGHN